MALSISSIAFPKLVEANWIVAKASLRGHQSSSKCVMSLLNQGHPACILGNLAPHYVETNQLDKELRTNNIHFHTRDWRPSCVKVVIIIPQAWSQGNTLVLLPDDLLFLVKICILVLLPVPSAYVFISNMIEMISTHFSSPHGGKVP